MTASKFKTYVEKMVEDFGVRSYLDNDEGDDLWFECPICGEPILYDDVDSEWATALRNGVCPICEENFYED